MMRSGRVFPLRRALGAGTVLAVLAAMAAMSVLAAGLMALSAVPARFGQEVGAGFSAVEQAACGLDRDGSAQIVVAGDSRAKSQIIPALITEKTGKRCVNIAEALNFGGDLATLVNVLRKNPAMLVSGPVLVISVSMDGVNDMSWENTPAATLYNFSLPDHLRLSARRPIDYPWFLASRFLPALKREFRHRRLRDGFICGDDIHLPSGLLASGGFRPLKGRRQALPAVADGGYSQRYLLDGARWRVYRESLRWLAASPARAVILCNAPMDPDWLRRAAGSASLQAESRFSAMAGREAAVYARAEAKAKVRYLDFFSHPVPELFHGDFHDGAHLNESGAVKFTRILADSLALWL